MVKPLQSELADVWHLCALRHGKKIVTISVYNDEHVKINITWLEVLKISVYNDEHVKIIITWLDQHYLVKSTLPG